MIDFGTYFALVGEININVKLNMKNIVFLLSLFLVQSVQAAIIELKLESFDRVDRVELIHSTLERIETEVAVDREIDFLSFEVDLSSIDYIEEVDELFESNNRYYGLREVHYDVNDFDFSGLFAKTLSQFLTPGYDFDLLSVVESETNAYHRTVFNENKDLGTTSGWASITFSHKFVLGKSDRIDFGVGNYNSSDEFFSISNSIHFAEISTLDEFNYYKNKDAVTLLKEATDHSVQSFYSYRGALYSGSSNHYVLRGSGQVTSVNVPEPSSISFFVISILLLAQRIRRKVSVAK